MLCTKETAFKRVTHSSLSVRPHLLGQTLEQQVYQSVICAGVLARGTAKDWGRGLDYATWVTSLCLLSDSSLCAAPDEDGTLLAGIRAHKGPIIMSPLGSQLYYDTLSWPPNEIHIPPRSKYKLK